MVLGFAMRPATDAVGAHNDMAGPMVLPQCPGQLIKGQDDNRGSVENEEDHLVE